MSAPKFDPKSDAWNWVFEIHTDRPLEVRMWRRDDPPETVSWVLKKKTRKR
jgi:hypothetical protein